VLGSNVGASVVEVDDVEGVIDVDLVEDVNEIDVDDVDDVVGASVDDVAVEELGEGVGVVGIVGVVDVSVTEVVAASVDDDCVVVKELDELVGASVKEVVGASVDDDCAVVEELDEVGGEVEASVEVMLDTSVDDDKVDPVVEVTQFGSELQSPVSLLCFFDFIDFFDLPLFFDFLDFPLRCLSFQRHPSIELHISSLLALEQSSADPGSSVTSGSSVVGALVDDDDSVDDDEVDTVDEEVTQSESEPQSPVSLLCFLDFTDLLDFPLRCLLFQRHPSISKHCSSLLALEQSGAGPGSSVTSGSSVTLELLELLPRNLRRGAARVTVKRQDKTCRFVLKL
jgi:hypothetical protein